MGNFFKAVRSGLQGTPEASEGEHFKVAGKPVACSHCAHNRFVEGRAQLNTAALSFLNLDWANRSAATLVCTRCGHIEWFLEAPESTE
jgi:predicted nucleic-acid-binding Zn-ribbon protein